MTRHQIAKSLDRLTGATGLASMSYVVRLAAFVRSHGTPCRITVGRKSGRVMLRCATSMGYDTSKIPSAQRRSWQIEMVKADMQSVREYLGY
jgi:hypothetical protein